MRQSTDHFGQPTTIGDAVIYAVKQSCDVTQHYGFVYGVMLIDEEYKLKIVSMRIRHSWDSGTGKYVFYKTTLTAQNFIKIPMTAVKKDILEELLKNLP